MAKKIECKHENIFDDHGNIFCSDCKIMLKISPVISRFEVSQFDRWERDKYDD